LLDAVPEAVTTPDVNATMPPPVPATPVQTPLPSVWPFAGTLPMGLSGRILFGVSQRHENGYTYPGVYAIDLEKQTVHQLFGPGVRFQSVSPDGQYLLVSEGSVLFRTLTDGTSSLQLTDQLFNLGNTAAVWLTDQQIAAVTLDGDKTKISLLSADGGEQGDVKISGGSPVEIYPGSNNHFVYWENGSCSALAICQREGPWVASLNGTLNQPLTGLQTPILAPDGARLVSGSSSAEQQNTLVLSAADGSDQRAYPLPGDLLVDYAWSPVDNGLAAILTNRDDYSGKVKGNRIFLIDSHTLNLIEYPPSSMLTPHLLWSPDGGTLLWLGTLEGDDGFQLAGSLVGRTSKQVTDILGLLGRSSPDYVSVTGAVWLPLP